MAITVTTDIILIHVREFQLEFIHLGITVHRGTTLRDIIIPQDIIVHPLDFMVAGSAQGLAFM